MGLLLKKQIIMRRVLISLLPIIVFSIYLFGWRVLAIIFTVTLLGILVEYFFEKKRASKPTESILVTCLLYSLTLPVTVPYWVAAIGIVFGVVFAKQVYGGFGRNVFNPALAGRCFVYVSFPAFMTAGWVTPFSGSPGGFAHWVPEMVDGMTRSTPMLMVKNGEFAYRHLDLFFGLVPGSIGETGSFLILLAAIYLVYKKTASWRIILSVFAGMAAVEGLFQLLGSSNFPDPIAALLSGGFLFAAVFMATDPVSAPSHNRAKILYGLLVGALAAVIRGYSLFPEGIMFAILIVNSFVPLMDMAFKSAWRREKA